MTHRVLWLKSLMQDIHLLEEKAALIHRDNTAATSIAYSVQHDHKKIY